MMNTDKIKDELKRNGFNCLDARMMNIIFGYQEHYYAAPIKGIYRINQKSASGLNKNAFRIFKNLAGRFHENQEDYMKGWFKSNGSDLEFRKGEIRQNPFGGLYFEVPYLQLRDINFWIHPSQEYINLFLNYVGKVEELYSDKKGVFEYVSLLKSGKKIKIPLVPTDEEPTLVRPLREFTKRRVFGVPPEKRHRILETISEDIRYFGGSYNWTTGYRGEDLDMDRYNNFFNNVKNRKFLLEEIL